MKQSEAPLVLGPLIGSAWLVALRAWLAIGCLLPNATGASVKVEGQLEAHFFRWDGNQASSQVTRFQISHDGHRWLLRSEFTPDWYELVGYDGTNTYSVLTDPSATNLPCTGSVFGGTFPKDAIYTVTIPWLAFCSSDYLAAQSEAPIPALWSLALVDPLAHACTSSIERSAAVPYLPARVTWITSSNLLARAGTDAMLRTEGQTPQELSAKRVNYGKLIPEGILLGEFNVTAWTNLLDLQIPLAFELKAFRYADTQQKAVFESKLEEEHKQNSLVRLAFTNDTYLIASYTGIVTSPVKSCDDEVGLPQVDKPMQVQDYRLSDRSKGIDYVIYTTTEWKRTVDKPLLRLLKAKQKHPPGVPRDTGGRKVLLLLALAAVFLMPVIVTLMARHRKHGNMSPSEPQMS